MNRKTIWSTLALLLGIGGAMWYLQANEAEKIEQTVLRVEAEKTPQFTAADFQLAAYVMYYKDTAFYTKDEATFFSKVDLIGRQSAMSYMYAQQQYFTESELQMYKQQARDEVAYDKGIAANATFYDALTQVLQMTSEDYVAYIYKMRLSDAMYERLSREQMQTTDVDNDPFLLFWRNELKAYDLSEETIDATFAKLEAQYEPVSPQPNWLFVDEERPVLLQHIETKRQHMRTHTMYDLYGEEAYSPMMYHIEREVGAPITRSALPTVFQVLQAYEPTEEETRAYEELAQIFTIYAADNEPFEQ